MSPDGGLSPGTSLFSIFLSPALLFPPTFFFLPFFRGLDAVGLNVGVRKGRRLTVAEGPPGSANAEPLPRALPPPHR